MPPRRSTPRGLALAALVIAAAADDVDREHVSDWLANAFRRRLQFRELPAEHLDKKGLLPQVELGGFRLTETFTVDRDRPHHVTRFVVPPDYVDLRRRRRRRLQDEGPAASGPEILLRPMNETLLSFNAPHRRVRLFAAMIAATTPDVYFEIPTGEVWPPPPWRVYDLEMDALLAESDILQQEGVVRQTSETTNTTAEASASQKAKDRYDREQAAKYYTSQSFRTALRGVGKEAKLNMFFAGLRSEGCWDKADSAEPCVGDVGTVLSVYQTDRYKVVVFHPWADEGELQYILWWNKMRLLESFSDEMTHMYTSNTGARETEAMLRRSGGMAVGKDGGAVREAWVKREFPYRCGFLNTEHRPFNRSTTSRLSTLFSLAEGQLEEKGPWLFVQGLLREWVFQAGVPIYERKETYLTGTGTGGTHAALASMWLKRIEEIEVPTVVIAPTGWQCLARKFPNDMTPWLQPTWIRAYAHVLDAFANAMDPVSGTLCLYGLQDVGRPGSPVAKLCERMIGHTGPELFYDPEDPTQHSEVADEGREAFYACHHFTHSIWYAMKLFQNDSVLKIDATTDGGCRDVLAIQQDDAFNRCPSSARAMIDCDVLANSVQALPVTTIVYIAMGLIVFIISVTGCLLMAMRRAQEKNWAFKRETAKGRFELPCVRCFKRYFVGDSDDRGLAARNRVQQRREKAHNAKQQKAMAKDVAKMKDADSNALLKKQAAAALANAVLGDAMKKGDHARAKSEKPSNVEGWQAEAWDQEAAGGQENGYWAGGEVAAPTEHKKDKVEKKVKKAKGSVNEDDMANVLLGKPADEGKKAKKGKK